MAQVLIDRYCEASDETVYFNSVCSAPLLESVLFFPSSAIADARGTS